MSYMALVINKPLSWKLLGIYFRTWCVVEISNVKNLEKTIVKPYSNATKNINICIKFISNLFISASLGILILIYQLGKCIWASTNFQVRQRVEVYKLCKFIWFICKVKGHNISSFTLYFTIVWGKSKCFNKPNIILKNGHISTTLLTQVQII
jgi:hypothetical protein